MVIKYYCTDNLRYNGRFRVGTALTLDTLMKENMLFASEVTTPIYFIQGGKDILVCPKGVANYMSQVKSVNKVFLEVADLEHDIPHDYRFKKYLEDISAWMSKV